MEADFTAGAAAEGSTVDLAADAPSVRDAASAADEPMAVGRTAADTVREDMADTAVGLMAADAVRCLRVTVAEASGVMEPPADQAPDLADEG